MECARDMDHKGSSSKNSEDHEPRPDIVCEPSACICKGLQKYDCLMQKGSPLCPNSKVYAPHGGIKPKRAKKKMLQLLVDMMIQNDRILQKVLWLQLQSKSLLDSLCEDTHEPPL
jgi:hypothetical protein